MSQHFSVTPVEPWRISWLGLYQVGSKKLAVLQNTVKVCIKGSKKNNFVWLERDGMTKRGVCSSACCPMRTECWGVETAHWARMSAIHSRQDAAPICPQLTATTPLSTASLLPPTLQGQWKPSCCTPTVCFHTSYCSHTHGEGGRSVHVSLRGNFDLNEYLWGFLLLLLF